MAVAAVLALSLAGCGPAGDVAIGLAGATLLTPLIGAAAGGVPVATYCETPQEALYTTDHWHCTKGDTELKPWDYDKMEADREAAAKAATHAEEIAAAAEPTYCRTAISRTAYRSSSNICASGEDQISQDQYDRARTEAVTTLTQIPPAAH